MTNTLKTITMAAVGMMAAVCMPLEARAHSRGGVSIGIGGVFGAPLTEQVLVSPGHYEMRTETVLVEKGHWDKVKIPAVEQLVRDHKGRVKVVTIQKERKVKVWVPDRFVTRTVRVWVPEVYTTRVVGTGAGPVINIGGRVRW